MKRIRYTLLLLGIMSAVMMSIPFLVPHTGILSLFGLVPLLCMERIASQHGVRRFWWWHYGTFVLWNAATTFWVGNATVGGAIFAILANSLQMSIIFEIFRWTRKRLSGVLPYIFLPAAWIAWEKWYLTLSQISWPWLVLGNSFAGSVRLVQWYSVTGTLGGSLWVWTSNLAIFGILLALSDGRWQNQLNIKAKAAAITSTAVVIFAPIIWSAVLWNNFEETSEPLDVVIAQPNFDPYQKFQSLTQDQQTAIIMGQITSALDGREDKPTLILTPETFTNDVIVGEVPSGKTYRRFASLADSHRGTNVLFGASSYELFDKKPSILAREINGKWYENHNSAIMVRGADDYDIYHKSKLVVGVEMTPYPKLFVPIDNLLGGVMGRNVGQKEVSLLNFEADGKTVPTGCAVCYESIYGEHCAKYVRKGARLLTVITNDAWWGDTPGYRQHLTYSSLRAIETRRDIARCANTGISAVINQRGEILSKTPWWEPAVLQGTVNLSDEITPFVRMGDLIGRLSVFVFILLLLASFVRIKKF